MVAAVLVLVCLATAYAEYNFNDTCDDEGSALLQATREASSRNYDYKFRLSVMNPVHNGKRVGDIFAHKSFNESNHPVSSNVWGCNSATDKGRCHCGADHEKFFMIGQGSEGTATALDFWCRGVEWRMLDPFGSCTCDFHVQFWSGSGHRQFHVKNCKQCFFFTNLPGSEGQAEALEEKVDTLPAGRQFWAPPGRVTGGNKEFVYQVGSAPINVGLLQSPSTPPQQDTPRRDADVARHGEEAQPAALLLDEAHSEKSGDSDFKFFLRISAIDGEIHPMVGVIKSNENAIAQGVTSSGSNPSGCNSDWERCKCHNNLDGSFVMRGQGSELTATGLTFQCNDVRFEFADGNQCSCTLKAVMYYNKPAKRQLEMSCTSGRLCFELVDQSGHSGQAQALTENINDIGEGASQFWSPPAPQGKWRTAYNFWVQAKSAPQISAPPSVLAGGWVNRGSGVSSLQLSESVTSTSTHSLKEGDQISRSLEMGFKSTFGFSAGDSPLTLGAKANQSFELSVKTTFGYQKTVEDTWTKTTSGTQTLTRKIECDPGSTYWQWAVNMKNGAGQPWSAIFDSAHFVCTKGQANQPKCPYGECCTGKNAKIDTCAYCKRPWCEAHSFADCPWNDPKFPKSCPPEYER